MTKSTDISRNPFAIDGKTSPPMRSAFATLGCEPGDLAFETVDQILERALAELDRDPESVTSYGRALTKDDLVSAADRLRDPEQRVLHALIDFPYFPFETGDVAEVHAITDAYVARLTDSPSPRLVDTALFAQLFRLADSAQASAPFEPPRANPPALPAADEVLKLLA